MTDTTITMNERMGEGMMFSAINVSAGDTEIIPSTSGKIITVHQIIIKADDDATVRFEDGSAGGTALTGIMPIFASATVATLQLARSNDGGILMPFSPAGWFWSSSGNAINMEVTGGNVDGVVGYSLRDA